MDSKAFSERRKAGRKPVLRRALFSGDDGALRVGEVADLGAGGLRIRTAAPARVGSEVDIEVHTASGDWLGSLRLRGRVVYTAGTGEDATMGVRLLPERSQAKSLPPYRPLPREYAREAEQISYLRESSVCAPAKRRLWPWAMPPAVLALLLLLLLWRVESLPASGADKAVDRVASAISPTTFAAKSPIATPASDLSDASDSEDLKHPIRPVPPLPLDSFEHVEGRASDLRMAVNVRASEGEASDPTDGAPWIYARSGQAGAQAALVPESEWKGVPGVAGSLQDSEVLVVVEKSAHRLILSRNGVVLRSFDVGLGRNDSTPEGDFRIAVKATNPAWRHNGRIIPGGTPENRLGKRWMGLGRDKTPTSYGIHPAKNTRAIGGNTSFGCIQMYPDDADALFRFCPLGTRVSIRA